MELKTALFDLGGVVCHFLPDRRITELAVACGTTAERTRRVLYEDGLIGDGDSGRLDRGELEAELRRRLGFTGTTAELHVLWGRAFEPDEEVMSLIGRIRPMRRALLTNNDDLLLAAFPAVFPGVAALFDRLVFSGGLGVTKPDPGAFRKALGLLGAEPSETFFVDDSERNVAGAREAGLVAWRFAGTGELAGKLTAAGLLID